MTQKDSVPALRRRCNADDVDQRGGRVAQGVELSDFSSNPKGTQTSCGKVSRTSNRMFTLKLKSSEWVKLCNCNILETMCACETDQSRREGGRQ